VNARRYAPALTALAFACACAAALPAQMDSQVVLNRYASKLLSLEDPKSLIFTYTVTQAGPQNIYQSHRIYRSGDMVRDETLSAGGLALHPKLTRIARYRDRYTIKNVAPRLTEYMLLFLHSRRAGKRIEYAYRAIPLGAVGAFIIEGVTIDLHTYLPSEIRFCSGNGAVRGSGVLSYAQSGKYWVPVAAAIQARVAGKLATERIGFSGYRFPRALPRSTFQAPRPLPTASLPPF